MSPDSGRASRPLPERRAFESEEDKGARAARKEAGEECVEASVADTIADRQRDLAHDEGEEASEQTVASDGALWTEEIRLEISFVGHGSAACAERTD